MKRKSKKLNGWFLILFGGYSMADIKAKVNLKPDDIKMACAYWIRNGCPDQFDVIGSFYVIDCQDCKIKSDTISLDMTVDLEEILETLGK